MSIIPGIQIRIPQWSERADAVIAGMERLLAQRMCGHISRRAFLVAWRKKRVALRLTRDYQELQERVRREAGGYCETCRRRPGDHMHHSVPVAFEPRRALDRSICSYVCVVCHEDEDELARERVLEDRERTKRRVAKFSDARQAYQRNAVPAKPEPQPAAESRAAKRPIGKPEATS